MTNPLGVYEKALPAGDIEEMLSSARIAGFDFFELAIDESQERLSRLAWRSGQRRAVNAASRRVGMPISVVTLSAHRATPLGSASAERRRRARGMLTGAIELAADLDAPLVQVAGYFVFYEDHHRDARRHFVHGLGEGCLRAAELGITLGLENVDGQDITSVDDGLAVLADIDHPRLGLHVDVGNLVGNELDVGLQLQRALPKLVAVDLKDARPDVFRRVPFGEGTVPFDLVWETLRAGGFTGPCAIEMWNDGTPDHRPAARARSWIQERARR